MRIWPLVLMLSLISIFMLGCIEGDEVSTPDTVVVRDTADPPAEVNVDVDVEEDDNDGTT